MGEVAYITSLPLWAVRIRRFASSRGPCCQPYFAMLQLVDNRIGVFIEEDKNEGTYVYDNNNDSNDDHGDGSEDKDNANANDDNDVYYKDHDDNDHEYDDDEEEDDGNDSDCCHNDHMKSHSPQLLRERPSRTIIKTKSI